jgi:hypothetical protein
MKENLKKVFLFTLTVLFIFSMIGCERSNTVASFVVSDRQYTERSDLEKAAQPEQLKAGKDVYLSVYFIESVKWMEYTVKWYMNEKEIKTDTQKFPVEKKGILVFALDGDKVSAGTLKVEIRYKEHILAAMELEITEE